MNSFYRKRRRHNSLRYPGRDYSLPGKYFVTICTADKREWFVKIIKGEMKLSNTGNIAYEYWCEIPEHFPYITLDEFIIMPNHIHGIIIINKNPNKHVVGSLHATTLLPFPPSFGHRSFSEEGSSSPLHQILESYPDLLKGIACFF